MDSIPQPHCGPSMALNSGVVDEPLKKQLAYALNQVALTTFPRLTRPA